MASNGYNNVLLSVIARAEQNQKKEDCDYVDGDGYLCCGKCHTHKQYEIDVGGQKRKVPILCFCELEKRKKEDEARKQRLRMERIEILKKCSLMDQKFASCSFESLQITEANKRQILICRRYAERFDEMLAKNQGLLLYGGVGTGKTLVACCIGNYLMERNKPVFVTSLVKILQKKKQFKCDYEEAHFIDQMNEASLLILDDLGAERSTDYALEIVYDVIDSRYRFGKPMIVTTNLSLAEMQQSTEVRYKRIYDRIFEVCYPLEFNDVSWRMKEAASRFNEMKTILEG